MQRFPYVHVHRGLTERSTARIGRFVVPELPHHVSVRARLAGRNDALVRGHAAASALRGRYAGLIAEEAACRRPLADISHRRLHRDSVIRNE